MTTRTNPLIWLAVLLALILLLVVLFCQPGKAQDPEPDPIWPNRVFIVEVRK